MKFTWFFVGEVVRAEGGTVEAGNGVAESGEGAADLTVAPLGHSDAVDVRRWTVDVGYRD